MGLLNRYEAVGIEGKEDRGGKDAGTQETPRAPLNSKEGFQSRSSGWLLTGFPVAL